MVIKNPYHDAKLKLDSAEHVLLNTYSKLKDPKVLLAVAETLHEAMTGLIAAFLYNEKIAKRISIYPTSTEAQLELFKEVMAANGFDQMIAKNVESLRALMSARKTSSMEFVRKETVVILNDAFDIKQVTEDKMKKYLDSAQKLAAACTEGQ